MPFFAPIGRARTPLLQALGHVLAADVSADRDLPGFDNSAMDGYAVRHSELHAGRALRVAGEARAGVGMLEPLPEGCAARIFTGAPLPQGADTVVMQENARRSDDGVTFDPLPVAGLNVRKRGSDLRRGALALPAGTQVGPGEIGLLAALGQHAGCEPWILPSVPDQLDAITAALEQALRADAVITSGGVSVGDYDLVAKAFAQAGVRTVFAKVAIKPGKPFWFGVQGRVPVVGLPG